ncbi:hypothetical protein BDY24DRAFT_375594 [Mrakia frigida]|uniref:uncharacterized protein n=1 Tax=Mrakia frigida TaxID=29902 RepID=UPI003FCC2442
MSLPPHPASASFLPPHPSLGIAPAPGGAAGAPPTWVASSSLAPGLPPPPPPVGIAGPSSLGGEGGRGDRDPISFTIPKPNFVLKPPDGTPLLRAGIQYDLLDAIFTNTQKVFTPPPELEKGPAGAPKGERMSFAELYTTSLACSSKGTKSMREKIYADPIFSRAMAMMSLLVNVGRVNTTLAFYPEMRTILRTYHAIPSLQKSEASKKHLQDAPRMKAALKGVLLDSERLHVPFSIMEVEKKIAEGARPPTSIVNLIFTFVNSSSHLSQKHFLNGVEPLDLFLPTQGIPSSQRAQAFLFLVWNYYEQPSSTVPNPFHDDFSRANPGKVPLLQLGVVQTGTENIDEEEEIKFGEEMKADRLNHLDTLKKEGDEIKRQVASGEREPGKKDKQQGRKRKSLAAHQSNLPPSNRVGSPYANSSIASPAGSNSSLPAFSNRPSHLHGEIDELEDELEALAGPSPSSSRQHSSSNHYHNDYSNRPDVGVNFDVGAPIGILGYQPSPSAVSSSARRELMDFGSEDEGSSVGQAPSVLMRGAATGGGQQQKQEMMTMMDVDRREENGSYGMSAGEEEVDELDESSSEEELEEEVFSLPKWNPRPARPPREKDLVRLAFARASSTKDVLADSDLDSDSDDQCSVDLRRKLSVVRAVQLAAPPLAPKPKPSAPSSSSSKPISSGRAKKDPKASHGATTTGIGRIVEGAVAASSSTTNAPPPTVSTGGGPKIKLNFGGAAAKARKTSLSSLLN